MKRRRSERYERLTHPLIREDGVLRRATWEEALDKAAEGFRRNIERHGPDAFGMLACARSTNEINYVAQKFTRVVIGNNNVDSCNRTCHAPSVAGLAAVFGSGGGTSSYEEVEHADVIVMWGSSAREAHPIFFQHVLKGIRNGARMYRRRPAAHEHRPVGGPLAGPQRRHRHPAGERGRPRDHPRRAGQHDVRRARHRAASRSSPPRSSRGRSRPPRR